MFNLFKKTETRSNKTLDQLLAIGTPTNSGQHVNAETAQSLPAVLCAVTTISEAIASLPIHVYQMDQSGDKQRARNHYAERLLNSSPNSYQTAYDFKIALLRAVLLRGNAFTHIEYDGAGKPTALHWLHPDSVIVKKLPNHRLGYQVTLESGKIKILHQEEIIHIKYMSDDGIVGKSPIQIARESIGLGLAQQEHGARLFQNGAMPSGVLETDAAFKDPNAANRIRTEFNQKYQGVDKRGEVIFLEQGLKYKPLSISNTDSEWLESRSFTVADIARIFKISPLLLQDLSHGTYSNFSEAQRAFLSHTLRPWLTNLQQAFNNRLVSIRSQGSTFIEFETKDLLRASTEERFSAYDVAIRNGIMSPNDARKAENMPARDGGDEFSQSWLNQLSSSSNS
ncbi:phage portal protein [Colwellia sp. Bg11-12]|uniref:phage portal protein n=1 Tax=Colwellia sp. Bg11-12 TaxID=2759817 RepID=UPI0015F6A4F9|nr:phage portal protein [Colwellia sp. Bg11-12]MBA6262303.1 phage portal protein [Colwellia sp. Bg11-12]